MSNLARSIAIVRDNSPYLAQSLILFPDLVALLEKGSSEQILQELFAGIPNDVATLEVEMSQLRILKRQAHLVIAVSDIARIWDWEKVTHHLTGLADFCLQRILTASARAQGVTGTDENPVPGLFILAVGKYGAHELNYSSDVDFNVFYDPHKIQVPNPARAERTLIKIVQGVVKGMDAMTEHGYIFRTDLRLRPDPRSNAVAVSTLTAERYYATLGQNWERAAMIKARACAGDIASGNEFIETVLGPFIWRKNMDYAAIEDILAIKRQIHARKDVGNSLQIAGHHLKLGVGGIREIEFYAQVQQLILGGRHPELRAIRTVDALAELAKRGFIEQGDAAFLTSAYGFLRTAEHAVQMINDEQTHKVPDHEIGQNQFAGLMGAAGFNELSEKLGQIFTNVRRTYGELFPEADSLSSSKGNLVFTGVEPGPDTLLALEALGYNDGVGLWYDMAAWLGGRVKATRTEKARELLTAIAPDIVEYCAQTGQPDKAFNAFRQFFSQLAMGVSLLSMFHQKPDYLKYVISLMTLSPMITEWVARRPSILDALSDPNFLNVNEASVIDHGSSLNSETDFESALNMTRRWAREARFRISAALLSGAISPDRAGDMHAVLAEAIIEKLIAVAKIEAQRRTGAITGDISVLGMGKLASRDLNLNSDLDLMVIYRPGKSESDANNKYAKFTQRLVSALSSITEEGPLYDVDMALRPSGRSGPVAVSCDAFQGYYNEKAWSWEFMALSRSRVIAATTPEFADHVSGLCRRALRADRADLDMPADIADMLTRLRKDKPMAYELDLKNARGGIREIEFIAQKLFLQNRFSDLAPGMSIPNILTGGVVDVPGETAQKLAEIYKSYLALLQYKSVWQTDNSGPLAKEDLGVFAEFLKFDNEAAMLEDLKAKRNYVESVVDELIYG